MNNDIFNGKPSIILDKRPYYSIIIPCYNSHDTLKNTLFSIMYQVNVRDVNVYLIQTFINASRYNDIFGFVSESTIDSVFSFLSLVIAFSFARELITSTLL